ncbi:MAG TPA: hypothetical protein VMB85_10000 [Bryobacteraceae bacterium]|nr:hypothetical protein [Bryobacteraceae bacterium]
MAKARVVLVNMIPKSLSGEINQDSEPQITVDPENPRTILGTAFTPDPGGGPDGPIYASADGGRTWTLDLVIPGEAFVPSIGQVLPTFDQSIRFGSGSALYGGILRTNTNTMNLLRSAPYSPTGVMNVVVSRGSIDQPYVDVCHAEGKDRVFVGNNDDSSGPYRGSVEHSPDARNAPAPAGFSQTALDPRVPFIRELPPIRCAAHRDGTVYAAYIPMRQFVPNTLCDVVVARDDNFGTGATPFTALTDPIDTLPGLRVRKSVPFPWTSPFTYLGLERIGSNLSITVDPRDSRVVYLVWGEGPLPGSAQTLRVRRSTDRGATWSGDLLLVPNAVNPALAMTEHGKVGFLYQQLVTSGGAQRWQTHVQVTQDGWATPADDFLLANTPEDPATYPLWDPHLGDYADLQAHGDEFYGIFSTNNYPDLANFPHGVHYQRNADFAGKQLYDVSGITPVKISIDPFFVHISWQEEHEERKEHREQGRERVLIKGIRHERWEIDEIEIEAGEWGPGAQEAGALLARIGERLEHLGDHMLEEEHHHKHHKHK